MTDLTQSPRKGARQDTLVEEPLGTFLRRSLDPVEVIPTETYKQITVRLHHRGVVLRGMQPGSAIGSSRQYRARAGQVVLSRIDARNGAIGLVPDDLDGAIVTNDFWLFEVDHSRILPEFLDYYVSTPSFVELCKRASEGTTNRVRLQPEAFLRIPIPLPPLAEQRRIVARVEALAAKIEEARGLRREAVKEAEAFLNSATAAAFGAVGLVQSQGLGDSCSKIGSGSTPRGGRAAYPDSGIPFIRSMNIGMRRFRWDNIAFIDSATHQSMHGTQVRHGDVLLNITGASIGRVACAPNDLAEANVNQHVAIIRPKQILNSRYLMYWLSQPRVQRFINQQQKGATRQGFTKAQIKEFEIPALPLAQQHGIVNDLDGLQTKIEVLSRMQTDAQAEMEALLPAVLDRAFRGEL